MVAIDRVALYWLAKGAGSTCSEPLFSQDKNRRLWRDSVRGLGPDPFFLYLKLFLAKVSCSDGMNRPYHRIYLDTTGFVDPQR